MREFLAGAGQEGRDLLAVDWDATPVGPPEEWSLSLGNAVRILLTSKFSMWMAWGPELTFFCNSAYRRDTLGTKYPWALGRPASEVWSEIWADIEPRIDQVMQAGEATWDEALKLFLERSGYAEETYHTFSYSPLPDDDGTIAGMLCVVAEVTDQVIAERRMTTLRDLGVRTGVAATTADAVRAACERLATNPASLPFVAVYLYDADGTSAHLTGHAGFELPHPRFPTVLDVAEGGPWPLAAGWHRESVTVEIDEATAATLPTGAWELPPRLVFVTPIAQPTEDHPYGVLVIGANRHRPFDDSYRDFIDLIAGHLSTGITDARAIEDQRRRADALAALDQAKTDFLANVSHELRTPLTLLLGPAEDALRDTHEPLTPRHRERLSVVTRNGQRMLQLVNTLLDYSRLEAGEDDARFVPTDVGRYTAELVSMFDSVAERVGLGLQIDCASAEAYLDHDHWSKVVLNLVSNAMKFTFEGHVSVQVAEREDHVELRVSDTGTGIPETELPHLFDRFHRVTGARSRSHEGSGIGLALVHELVTAHGGTVEVSSTLDVGTTFTVRVPRGRDHLPPQQVSETRPDHDAVAQRHEARVTTHVASWSETHGATHDDAAPSEDDALGRILVVDDNDDMRGYVAGLLRQEGYLVRTAADGIEALELLREDVPDLVMTDVMMPRLDGFGLVRAMQADPVLTVVPVVMLSARAGEEGTLEALDAGVDDYLVKPFSARELLARVRVNLALDRAARVRDVLERSRDQMDQAQRLASMGSWEIDLDDDTITASDQFMTMLELTEADLRERGTTRVITDVVHPDDVDRVLAILRAAQPGDRIAYETRAVLPSGAERLFSVRGDLSDGGRRVIRGSFQDITEQRATQERLIAAEAEHTAALRERDIADALQRALLPDHTVEIDRLEIATHYRAGTEGTQVGGDWYDVIDLGAGRAMLVIGDVMGRGVRAAAATGQLRAAVRAFASIDLPPTELLEQLDMLVQELREEQIVTCVVAVVDTGEQTVSYANAGHLPVLVVGPGGARRLTASGPPLGAGFFGVEPRTLAIEPGDTLALYTDGLVERRAHDLFADIDGLETLIVDHHQAGVDDLAQTVVSRLARDTVDDDVALLLVRVSPVPTGATSTLRLDHEDSAPARARDAVAEHLHECGAPASVIGDAVLAVSELVTNAVLHARPPITLRITCTPPTDDAAGQVLLEVLDRTLLRPRRQRPDDDDEHGRGMNIVEAISSSWGIHRLAQGKSVWCTFTWE